MICDYECPRCHNKFPSSNKILHDIRCTEENPLQNKEKEKEKENILEIPDNIPQIEEKNENKNEEIPISDNCDYFECNICHMMLPELEINDHILCHDLEKHEKDKQKIQRQIAEQKRIEKEIKNNIKKKKILEQQKQIERQIKLNNERNQNQQNNQNHEQRQNNNINNNNEGFGLNFVRGLISDFNNIFSNNNNQRQNNNNNNNIPNNHNSNNIPNNRINQPNPIINRRINQNQNNINNNHIRVRPRPQNLNNNNNHNQIFINIRNNFNNNNNNNNNHRHHIRFHIPAHRHDNPIDRQIMNQLPEIIVEDVNKLDNEKKNCVICLEDFKTGDKATILPCIHMFHNNCIKNWLKKQNCCPICKFKITEANLQS